MKIFTPIKRKNVINIIVKNSFKSVTFHRRPKSNSNFKLPAKCVHSPRMQATVARRSYRKYFANWYLLILK